MTKKRAIRTGFEIISMPPSAEPPVNNRTGNSGCRSVRGQFSVNAQKAVLFSGTNGRRFSSFRCVLALVGRDQVDMKKPPEIKIVREAYELWEQSGKPDGRDQDFYLQAWKSCRLCRTLMRRMITN